MSIHEVKKTPSEPEPPKRRSHPLIRLIAFLVTVALACGAVFLVVNRDKINFDALRRWFTYRTLARSDTGVGESFAYQGGGSLTLAACNGDLLSVSQTGVRLYSPGGVAYVEDTVTLSHPVCQVSKNAAVVYDAGGTFLAVYRDREQVFQLEGNATILSARLGTNGSLAVVTRSSGYKGVVTVYNSSFRRLLELNLSSAFALDAVPSPDGRDVLVVAAGEQDHLFNCTLARYTIADIDPENPVPSAVWPLGNRLPLDLIWDANGIRVMAEYAALAADNELRETAAVDWSDRYLKRYSLLCSDVFVTLTGKYQAGSQTTLEVYDRSGERLGFLESSRPILDLSAAGKYVAVLSAQQLDIYTQDLELYATIANTQNASHVVLLEDGSVFLADQSTAWLQLPN